jgi:two-component system NtrC family sensor kinase
VPRGLAQQLILSLTVIVIIIAIVSGVISLKSQERHLLDAMILGADQLSKGITSATWHAMLADNREAANQVMSTIALKQGIDRIRLFNREGRVIFSTVANDPETRVMKNSAACSVCHSKPQPSEHPDVHDRVRVFRNDHGQRVLTMVTPIYNEPSCSQAACHAHPASMKVLGVLDVTLKLESVDEQLAEVKLQVASATVVQIVLIGIVLMFFTRYFVGRPIHRLIEATRAVSAMQLDVPIETNQKSEELHQLASSFDVMRLRLRSALEELNQLTQRLEEKVEQRTQQLKAAHQKLLQSDRLASLGQLAASVAHEINNPVSGVLNLSMLMQRIMKDDGVPPQRIPEFKRYLTLVTSETSRVGRIVSDLLAFSRRSKPHRSEADLNHLISSTLSLISHKLKLSNVEVTTDLDPDLPPVLCDSSQMQQVLLNLVLNAAEATQGRADGRLTLTTRRSEDGHSVTLVVADNGEGIPEENLPKIFDPFFTTKSDGKGVGLGLAVLYGIVDAHHGEISVASKTGEGTAFTITLPIHGGRDEMAQVGGSAAGAA